jgi:hypothetical protein
MSKKLIDSKADILPNPHTLVFAEYRLQCVAVSAKLTEFVD